MVKIKKMNESFFAKLLKEFNVAGELIRARQEEKEGLLDEFDQTCKRFFFGKISERALASSVKKTNRELQRLDKEIRIQITGARKAAERAAKLTANQAPIRYRATLSGISGGETKKRKKKSSKRKTKKKPARKKSSKKKSRSKAKKSKPKKSSKKKTKRKSRKKK